RLNLDVPSCLAEDAARITEQDRHRERVDEECTKLGREIFKAGIRETEHQGGEKRSADAAKATDGNDDEEVSEVVEGVAGRYGQQFRSKSAAKRGKPAAERKSSCEKPGRVDSKGFGHAQIVDGSTEARPKPCPLERNPQHRNNNCAA